MPRRIDAFLKGQSTMKAEFEAMKKEVREKVRTLESKN
jgi:hypothetical protein